MPEAHESAHIPAWQSSETQSAGVRQICPTVHLGQSGPPQSLSLSLPLGTRSSQAGSAQLCSTHTPVWQSEPALQIPPTGQGWQAPPPQSTSVSLPPSVSSLQPAA